MILNILGFLHLTWVDILDIIVVALLIYVIFRWIRGTSAMNIFIAIIFLLYRHNHVAHYSPRFSVYCIHCCHACSCWIT